MKGTILICLKLLVTSKFGGNSKWLEIVNDTGVAQLERIKATEDIDDTSAIKAFLSACKILNMSFEKLSEEYGDYWSNGYANRIYPLYYSKNKNAREFLLDVDNIHIYMTSFMENARPPRFKYEWKNDNTLIMHYESDRNVIDLLVGLAKGLGTHYQEKLNVRKLDAKRMQVIFN